MSITTAMASVPKPAPELIEAFRGAPTSVISDNLARLPGAVREGRKLLRETRHDVILVSGPPFSSFLIGAKLSRETGVPLVLDYRDEWTISNAYWENKRLDPVSRYVQDRMQRRVVRAAGRTDYSVLVSHRVRWMSLGLSSKP